MEKLKDKAKHFFYETKLGRWIFKSMALLNSIEGVVHLVVAVLGIVSMFSLFGFAVITHLLFFGGVKAGLAMWGIALPNIENIIFGVFSLIFAIALGIEHHNHEHKE